MYSQQAIDFAYDQAQTFESFWPGANGVLVDVLYKFARGDGTDRQVFLSGSHGAGKTHLLSATCAEATAAGARIAYLPAGVLDDQSAVDGLDRFDLICIDDLQSLPDTRDSEMALFTLINALRQHQGRLVLAADQPIVELSRRLPDLTTRLQWGASFVLAQVPLEQLADVLSMRARQMGLDLGDEILDYLLNRYPRQLPLLIEMIKKIDQASLQAKRRITVPFIREILPQPGT